MSIFVILLIFFIVTNIYASDDIIVNQNMFISKFQSHDNPMIYNITHDIYLNESMLFLDDNYNEAFLLIGSPPSSSQNKTYIEISSGNVMNLRPVLIYKIEIEMFNLHFKHSRVVGAVLNIQGIVKFHNCKFTEHMHVPGSGIYNFGGITILNNVFFEYHQTISGCCIYRPYDPAFQTEDYKWTDKIYKTSSPSNVRLEVTEEALYNILTKENPSFKVDNVEYTNVRFHT